MKNYTLDPAEAKKTEYTGSRIDETGKYLGKFTRAEDIKAQSGAIGIEFDFEATDGRKTRLNIYTRNKLGEPIFGQKMLMALMTCMKVREINAKAAKVTKYDYDTKADAVKDAHVFPELQEKPIGLLLQAEEYEKSDGSGTGWKMNIAGCFDSATELTPSEILDKRTKPEVLAKMVAALKDKPLKAGAAPRAAATGGGGNAPAGAGRFDDMDDDIPF